MQLIEIIGFELLDTALPQQLLELRDKKQKNNALDIQLEQHSIEEENQYNIEIDDNQEKYEEHIYQTNSSLFDFTFIPHTNKKPKQIELLKVNQVIPQYFLPAFEEIEYFNNIQTQIFNSAFKNDQNLLISAPTGSGKTNIALLCILRLIQTILNQNQNIQDEYIQYIQNQQRKLDDSPLNSIDFQCVYLTPLKALASEITQKFKESLEKIGINVVEITGDSKPPNSIWQQANVLIMTPQMMDIITRQPDSETGLFTKLNLLIIDEIHQIGDKSTGPVYETITMRTLYYSKILQKQIRIVGLSATIPNYQTFGKFINAPEDNWKVFEDYYRPVPIDTSIINVKQLKLNMQQVVQSKKFLKQNNKRNQLIEYLQQIENKIVNEFEINKIQQNKQEDINKHENVKKTKLKQKQFDYNEALDQISLYLSQQYMQTTNVLLFVNSKAKTVQLAQQLATLNKTSIQLTPSDVKIAKTYDKGVLFNCLIKQVGFHNSSLTKPQRQLVEKLFKQGLLKTVVCTATLVIGINAPAQVVIVRGTTFISENGKENLDMNMIKQVLGRAGRPQFTDKDQIAQGIILTDQTMYSQYVNQFDRSRPIQSSIYQNLEDIINSEVVLGNLTTPEEIVEYFKMSFAYLQHQLSNSTILQAIENLINSNILKGQKYLQLGQNNTIQPTSLSRICSYSLMPYKSLQKIITLLKQSIIGQTQYGELLYWISQLDIFKHIGDTTKQQMEELSQYTQDYSILDYQGQYKQQEINKFIKQANQQPKLDLPIQATEVEPAYKVSILIQTFVQRLQLKQPQLITDQHLIMQQIKRVFSALKELFILFKRGNEVEKLIQLQNSIQYQIPLSNINPFYGLVLRPLGSYQQGRFKKSYQILFESQQRYTKEIQISTITAMKNANINYTVEQLRNMKINDLQQEIGNANASQIINTVKYIPFITYYTKVVALSQNVLRIKFFGKPGFVYNKNYHDSGINYLIMFQQAQSGIIIKATEYMVTQDNIDQSINITCLINIKSFNKINIGKQQISYTQYVNQIKQQNEFDDTINIDLNDLSCIKLSIVCESFPGLIQQEILDLHKVYYSDFNPFQYRQVQQHNITYQSKEQKYFTPLPKVHSLSTQITGYQQLFKFQSFNPIQSVAFHKLFYSFDNTYIGAPTSTGKTTCCEIAIINALKNFQNSKIIYIAPLKAIVNERFDEWQKFQKIGVQVANLTGEQLPDTKQLYKSRIICTTPEKFDAVTRFQELHKYLDNICLIIIDEVHLISSARGWILENIIARYIKQEGIRFVAMSTATSNVKDIMQWLNIKKNAFFNFDNKARPLNLFSKLQGYIGEKYCERMEIMNKPVYNYIKQYNQYGLHTLVFVASRKQTRKTGYALLSFSQQDISGRRPQIILQIPNDRLASGFIDQDLRQLAVYGIGIHHASLCKSDRDLVLQMYIAGYLKLLICTSTLAFGINVPSYLTIIKGCEYYDKTSCQYIDHDISTIQQMMGRAGRVQFIQQKYENMINMYLGNEVKEELKQKNIFKGMFTFDKQLILQNIQLNQTQLEMLDKIEELDKSEPKAVSIVMCKESMKEFYQQFMNDPLPFESSLINSTYGNSVSAAQQSVQINKGQDHLAISINALIASEITISFKDIIQKYLHLTFYFLRARKNPQLYQIYVDDLPQQIDEMTDQQINQLQPYFSLYAPGRQISQTPRSYLLDFFVCLQIYHKVENIIQQLIDYSYIIPKYDQFDKQQLIINAQFTATNLSISTAMYYLKIDTQYYFIKNYLCVDNVRFVDILSFSEEFYEVPVRKEENNHMEKLYKEWQIYSIPQYSKAENMMNQYVKTHFLLQTQQNMYKIQQRIKQEVKYPTPEFQLDLNSILSNIPRYCSAILDTCINQHCKVEKLIEIEKFIQNIVTGQDHYNKELQQQKPLLKYQIFGQKINNNGYDGIQYEFETKLFINNQKQLNSYITTPYYQFQKSRTFYVALCLNGRIIECKKINHLLQNQIVKQTLKIDQQQQNNVEIVFANDIFKDCDKRININLQNITNQKLKLNP